MSGHPTAAGQANEHPVSAVRTHAYTDAPPATAHAPYPVLLFAPGLGTTPLEYASVIEDVVSHGYVVAGIVPTYFAGASVFSDGHVVRWRDPMLMPGTGARPRSTDEALRRMEAAADVESKDLAFALNLLAGINADARSPMRGSVDLTRVGRSDIRWAARRFYSSRMTIAECAPWSTSTARRSGSRRMVRSRSRFSC